MHSSVSQPSVCKVIKDIAQLQCVCIMTQSKTKLFCTGGSWGPEIILCIYQYTSAVSSTRMKVHVSRDLVSFSLYVQSLAQCLAPSRLNVC